MRKRLSYAGLAILTLYGGWQGWLWWLRNEPIDVAADAIIQSFNDRNAATLWHYSDDGEKDSFNLSRAKFDAFLMQYVWPQSGRAAPSRVVREDHKESGVYIITQYYAFDQREVSYSVVVFTTPNGPKANVITPAVFMVFDIKYGGEYAALTGATKWFSVRLRGAEQERSTLESYGVIGTKDSPPGESMVPWERDIDILRKFLQEKK